MNGTGAWWLSCSSLRGHPSTLKHIWSLVTEALQQHPLPRGCFFQKRLLWGWWGRQARFTSYSCWLLFITIFSRTKKLWKQQAHHAKYFFLSSKPVLQSKKREGYVSCLTRSKLAVHRVYARKSQNNSQAAKLICLIFFHLLDPQHQEKMLGLHIQRVRPEVKEFQQQSWRNLLLRATLFTVFPIHQPFSFHFPAGIAVVLCLGKGQHVQQPGKTTGPRSQASP